MSRQNEKYYTMSRQVIIGKRASDGVKRVFLTLEEVSEALNLSTATVCRAIQGAEQCGDWFLRRADRIYAVKLKAFNSWRVVQENGRGTGYVEYGNPMSRIGKREVSEIRDLTLSWYL